VTPLHRPETLSLLKPISGLYSLIGREVHLEDTLRNLGSVTRDLHPAAVGAVQLTCSDESEKECCDIFQRRFAQHFLSSLKFSNYSPLRLVNIGSRYEWGAIRIADSHYQIPPGRGGFKLMVIKINAHVAVTGSPQGTVFGCLSRRGMESNCCGALHSLFEGGGDPFCSELKEDFLSEGKDRMEALLDDERVDSSYRMLFAAIVNSRLQARKAIMDIQDHTPVDPSICLVLPCVTLNRSGRDTEIVCGIYTADWLSSEPRISYCGLGSDPGEYRVEMSRSTLYIRDGGSGTLRQARDHRKRIHAKLRDHRHGLSQDPRLEEIETALQEPRNTVQPYVGVLLKSLMGLLLEVSPIPAVLLLFGEGLIDICKIHKLEKITAHPDGAEKAGEMLGTVMEKVDELPAERAHEITGLVLRQLMKLEAAPADMIAEK
jgi:hypothetical protein